MKMEVKALKEIGKKMEKKDWDFRKDPCTGEGNWDVLTCDCSFQPNSSCHLIDIVLTAQNLTGIIPPEFSELRYLKTLILSRNCLTGSVPKEWASMHLEVLSFLGNRLSGSFPEVLTRITTLQSLSLEGNRFSGPIPPEIGKLVNVEDLSLSSNSFSGPLPEQFGQLTNLRSLDISGNNCTGQIPDFIGNWTRINMLKMFGSGLDGPLPSSISYLTSLSNLQISDLGGKLSSFPPLENMTFLSILELRRCNINGRLPKYIGDMMALGTLDLSFNLLTGNIPSSFTNLKLADYIYLTGNKFTGGVPNELIERNKMIDISNNNFTTQSAVPSGDCDKTHNASGVLSEGRMVAVKKLSSKSNQGSREFVNELGIISSLQHPNLVKHYGCCVEKKQLILVYEYLENNCLSRALFGEDERWRIKLEWPTRKKICLGIARGLTYLHEDSVIKIVHRDIKASNVLLDEDLNAKISDFGLAKLNDDEHSHTVLPEHCLRFARQRGSLLDLVDPVLASDYSKEEAMLILNVALMSTNTSPALRPKMSQVLRV
ncbi:hypothetical protein EUTSA_v10010902mg [Eutrema salsugineum]|uniref:non-specific serine/threonine protein kinase n=1 Tax=Eutrema salsugineum TaxID=72664 RepID=V4LYE0_EUTSA|nr:hypothetical protein EUTSA_v10010902mg [Eutrema salsugineum]